MDRARLENSFLNADRRRLAALRRETPGTMAPEVAFARLPDAFRAGERWFEVGRRRAFERRVDVRAGKLRPVARCPGELLQVLWTHAAWEDMLEAERLAGELSRGLDGGERQIVWRFTTVGQHTTRRTFKPLSPVRLPEPEVPKDRVDGWVAVERVLAAFQTGEHPAIVAPWLGIFLLGFAVLAVNEETIVLQHSPDAGAPVRRPARPVEAQNALRRAVLANHPASMAHALGKGADPNAEAYLASLARTWHRYDELAERLTRCTALLLDAGHDPVRRGSGTRALLERARRVGSPGVEVLVRGGLSIDVRDEDGRTALHHAARTGPDRAVEALLADGAAVDVRDGLGWTPLHMAASAGAMDRVELLLERGADPLRATGLGRLPGDLCVHPALPSMAAPVAVRGTTTLAFPGDERVYADQLVEAGDPRGFALQLVLAGRTQEADDLLAAHRALWFDGLAQVHRDMEVLLHDPRVHYRFRAGFLEALELGPASADYAHVLPALLASRSCPRLREVGLWRPGPLDSSGWRSDSLTELRIRGGDGRVALDTAGMPALERLFVDGPAVRVAVRSKGLRSLVVERPFQPEDDRGPLFEQLEAPGLRSVQLTWERAPSRIQQDELFDLLGHGGLASVALRPVSEQLLDALVGFRPNVQHLELASLWGRTAQRVPDVVEGLAGVGHLTLRVLDLDRVQRHALRRALVGRPTTVKGISYRSRDPV